MTDRNEIVQGCPRGVEFHSNVDTRLKRGYSVAPLMNTYLQQRRCVFVQHGLMRRHRGVRGLNDGSALFASFQNYPSHLHDQGCCRVHVLTSQVTREAFALDAS